MTDLPPAGGADAGLRAAGKRVTLDGRALNAKLGAVVVLDTQPVYVTGLDAWPDGLHGEQVRVTGTLHSRKLAPDPVMLGESWVLDAASWQPWTASRHAVGSPQKTASPPAAVLMKAQDAERVFGALSHSAAVPMRASPASSRAPLFPRLRDAAGPVPGLAARTVSRTEDPTRCGGFAVVVTRVKGKAVAPPDRPLADVLDLTFPIGSEARRQASERKPRTWSDKLGAWTAEFGRIAGGANRFYEDQLTKDDPVAKVVAAARLVQVNYRLASLLARAEVPSSLRRGEPDDKIVATYCDALAEKAEPFLERGETIARVCAEKLLAAVPEGWWTVVCVAP